MTLDVYAGLFSDDLDQVAERINAAALAAVADCVRTDLGTVAPLRQAHSA
jgi:hypothetical protein